jgi:hypothetical protein
LLDGNIMIRWLAALLTALTTLLAPSTDLCAQSTDASTFLTPFPDGDRYRVQIWGDSMSAGLLEALKEAMAEETRFAIEPKHRWIGGLLKSNADEEVKSFEQKLGNPPPHIVVMMLGAQDRLAMRRGNKRAGCSG